MILIFYFILACGGREKIDEPPKPQINLASWNACKQILVQVKKDIEKEKKPPLQ